MSLSVVSVYNPATDGPFPQPIPALEAIGAVKSLISTDDGICYGYSHPDGRVWAGTLVTPNSTKIASDNAAATAKAADQTKFNTAINTILANVNRVQTSGAGSGTDANRDNWLMAVSYIILKQG